jgi:uncharacterized membrane protein YhiD involved in acid resistance
MFTDLTGINLFPISAADVLTNLAAALLCGLMLSVVYRATYRGPSYSVSYVNALVMLTVIAALVILVIGNNLARAFGLVGAMSIIRFRTAVRDTMDMVYIFLSLALGLACGVGLQLVAVLGAVVSGLLVTALSLTNFGAARQRYYLIQVAYDGLLLHPNGLEQSFGRYCRSIKLVSVRSTGYENEIDVAYQVLLKHKATDATALTQHLQQLPAVRQVQFFFDEDDVNPPTM